MFDWIDWKHILMGYPFNSTMFATNRCGAVAEAKRHVLTKSHVEWLLV
jgi:hypothetical protein